MRAWYASVTPTRSTYVIVASNPSSAQSSIRTVMSLFPEPSGSARSAACHSSRPYVERRYRSDSTAMTNAASRTPRSMKSMKLVPGTKSHACNIVR